MNSCLWVLVEQERPPLSRLDTRQGWLAVGLRVLSQGLVFFEPRGVHPEVSLETSLL